MKNYFAVIVVVRRTTLMLALSLISLVTEPSLANESGKSVRNNVVPNTNVQSAIQALLSSNQQQMFSGTAESLQGKLDQLRKMAGQDKDLVLQLLYFSVHTNGMRETMLPGVILEQLAIPKTTIADAVLPLLDSEDETMHAQAPKWLPIADCNPTGGVDFCKYEGILREKKQNPSQGLIRYMYTRDPKAAVLSMARVYGDKSNETELTDQLKSNSKTVLQSLTDRPEWWVRLYVVETMKQNPHQRDAAILNKLAKDDNPLVKETVVEITSGK